MKTDEKILKEIQALPHQMQEEVMDLLNLCGRDKKSNGKANPLLCGRDHLKICETNIPR